MREASQGARLVVAAAAAHLTSAAPLFIQGLVYQVGDPEASDVFDQSLLGIVVNGILQPVVRAKGERTIERGLFLPGTDENPGFRGQIAVRELNDRIVWTGIQAHTPGR